MAQTAQDATRTACQAAGAMSALFRLHALAALLALASLGACLPGDWTIGVAAGCVLALPVTFAMQWFFVRRLAASSLTVGWHRRGWSALRWLSCAISACVAWLVLTWFEACFTVLAGGLLLCVFLAGMAAVTLY